MKPIVVTSLSSLNRGRDSCFHGPRENSAPEFSADASEISAEISVNIARTSRKNAVANRIALIIVLPDNSFSLHAFHERTAADATRTPARNADAIDSHRKI
ncbi:MAG TPA: hypothetical protein VKH46_05660 [Thermoanaerobaculia bacterium]|jgi:hypothetical protein|nr:hypothetical protein [Thermoanaerobaculia bacterium]